MPAPSITIWVTDHFISRRVCAALKTGLGDDALLALAESATPEQIAATPIHIGYGILRGMEKVTALADAQNKHWFLLDLGYTNPGHFHGNYRIGHKGTQTLFSPPPVLSREGGVRGGVGATGINIAPWKQDGDTALLCPPTDYVAAFYKIDDTAWCEEAEAFAKRLGLPAKFRRKGDPEKLPEKLDDALEKAACVITFNSSVAWQALQKGIPAFSDITRSTVGSWHGEKGMESLAALKALSRENLFRFMAAHELDLLAIQKGSIRSIIQEQAGL